MFFQNVVVAMPFLSILVMLNYLPILESAPLQPETVIRRGRTLQDLYRYVQQQYLLCLKCPNCPCDATFSIRRRSDNVHNGPLYWRVSEVTPSSLDESLEYDQSGQFKEK
ncbi:unnamed protein product [Hymenolepis diminuta]|uniref:Uncharacterized protein n=1 Tax=Hymenolepis diminuta TaxID=6216 RepID=A0A564ZB50_HYMDI|nr:unnamed protein product [Hymenolepis diminuta]